MRGIFVEFFGEGHRITEIVLEDVVALFGDDCPSTQKRCPAEWRSRPDILCTSSFGLTQEVKLDSILDQFLGVVHLYGETTSPFQHALIDGKDSLGHIECTALLKHEIKHRPYDNQLVSVVLWYCPPVECVETFLDRLESPACPCLGKWRHAICFVPCPVHPHLGEACYPHPHDDAKVLCDINHTSTTPPARTRLAHFHSLVMGIIVRLLHQKKKKKKNLTRRGRTTGKIQVEW